MEFDESGDSRTFIFDPQGNCLATSYGLIKNPQFYDAYGLPTMVYAGDARSVQQPFQYKGQAGCLTDGFSGLVCCLHRYYDPTSGRWTSRDPIGLDGGMNVYGYCGGDPVLGFDPSGLQFSFDPQQYWRDMKSVFRGELSAVTGLVRNPIEMFKQRISSGAVINPLVDIRTAYAAACGLFHQGRSALDGDPDAFGSLAGGVLVGLVTDGEGEVAEGLQLARAADVNEGIYVIGEASGKFYVGQSSDIARRLMEHIGSGKKFNLNEVQRIHVPGGKLSRELAEQAMIERLGGISKNGIGKLSNRRNAIGQARRHLMPP